LGEGVFGWGALTREQQRAIVEDLEFMFSVIDDNDITVSLAAHDCAHDELETTSASLRRVREALNKAIAESPKPTLTTGPRRLIAA
jgi:hypothetical protein